MLAHNAGQGSELGHLCSLDADERWVEVTDRGFPDELKPFFSLNYSPLSIVDFDGVQVHRHDATPDVAPDLLLIGEPKVSAEVPVACDALDLERRSGRGFDMLFDKRYRNVTFLKEQMVCGYDYEATRGRITESATRLISQTVCL